MFRVFSCLTGEHDWRLVVLAGLGLPAREPRRDKPVPPRPRRARPRALAPRVASARRHRHRLRHLGDAFHRHAGLRARRDGDVRHRLDRGLLDRRSGRHHRRSRRRASARRTRWAAPIGGAIVGAGVAGMHYLGMWALEVPGNVGWSADLVLASIVLGIVLAAVALDSRHPPDGPRRHRHRRRAADTCRHLASFHGDGRGSDRARPDAGHSRQRTFAGRAGAGRGCRRHRRARHEPDRRDRGQLPGPAHAAIRARAARIDRGIERAIAAAEHPARRGPQQHVAGPVHVRCGRGNRRLQPALPRNVQAVAAGGEAGLQVSRPDPASQGGRPAGAPIPRNTIAASSTISAQGKTTTGAVQDHRRAGSSRRSTSRCPAAAG